jgi:hypothetical protein
MMGYELATAPVIAPSPLEGEGIADGQHELGRVRGTASTPTLWKQPLTRLRFAKPPSPSRGEGKRIVGRAA